VCSSDLFEGGSDGSFNPEKTMSMAELVTILYRTAGYTTDNSGAYWYSKQLSWALDNGIIAQADFSAASPVSRETFITMFYNTVKVTGKYNTSVTEAMQTALKKATDYSSLNPATLDKLAWAVGWGLIKGTDGNSLTVNPAGSIKRSEVCTMLMRYLSGLTVK
jgi:flavin-binding protein dodecin